MNFKPGSPQLTPLSNVNHPAYKPTSPVPSSPLRDSIPAVRERISTLFRSGKAAQLLQNASRSAPVSASYKKNFHPAKASGTPFGPSTGHYSPYSPLTPAHGSPSPASVSWNGMQSGKSQGQQANANSASASLYIMELYAKKRKLMLEIQVKDIIIGFVSQKSSKGITIHCTKCWKSDGMLINIDPFNIDAVCPLSELSTDIEQEEDVFIEKEELVKSNRDQFDLLDCFSIGTVVKAVLTSIDPHLDVVECSMKAETLRQSSLNRFISKLGICSNEEEDQIKQQALALTWASVSSSTAEKPSFNETRSQNSISVKSLVLEELESHPLFLNPSGLQLILKTLKIDEFGSLLPLQKYA